MCSRCNDDDPDIDGDGILNDEDDSPFGILGFSNSTLNTLEELSNNNSSGKLEGYWTFDSLTLNNKVNGDKLF